MHSASVRFKNRRTSLELAVESALRQILKIRSSGVEITQILRQNFTTEKQHFRKFGAPRAQKMRAFGQRAFLKSYAIAATSRRVGVACKAQKACVRRRDHANVAANGEKRKTDGAKQAGGVQTMQVFLEFFACVPPGKITQS